MRTNDQRDKHNSPWGIPKGIELFGWKMNARVARSIAWLLVAVYIILSATGLYLLGLTNTIPGNSAFPLLPYAVVMIVIGIWPVIGAQIISHHPHHPVGWLLFITFPVVAIVMFAIGYASYATSLAPDLLPIPGAILFWLKDPGMSIAIVALTLMFLLFPTGKLLSSSWRFVAWTSIGALPVVIGLLIVRPGPLLDFPSLDNPDAVSGPVWAALAPLHLAAITLLTLCSLAALVSLFLRLRRAQGDEAQQVKWLLLPAVIYWIGIPVYYLAELDPSETLLGIGGILHLIGVPAIVIAVAFAIFKYRLYDVDIIINRTLVYSALTAIVVVIYVLVVGALGSLFQAQGSPIIALLATGLVAVLFQPLRERLQQAVNRLFFGQRDDPMRTLAQLGKRLEAAIAPEIVLPTLVETISQTLKLPYVAISLRSGDEFKIAAQCGINGKYAIRIPLNYQGETVGQLIAGPRGPGEQFSKADRQLLKNIAHQAGPAAYAVQLTQDLRQSRVRLVTAREEERRRLRRDLHDGLGPILASQGLKMAAVSQLIDDDPDKAQQLLEELAAKNEITVAEIRRLVYELRPAVLDDLGLVGAVQDYASGLKGGTQNSPRLKVDVQASAEGLPSLPAAVEVAAYRISTEALTNVARHAQARHAKVSFVLNSTNRAQKLHLEIVDDGIGLPENQKSGIGLISMRERAEEVGGNFLVKSSLGQGTRVVADLPLVEVA
jgi:two-component system NarL family sensor kinase